MTSRNWSSACFSESFLKTIRILISLTKQLVRSAYCCVQNVDLALDFTQKSWLLHLRFLRGFIDSGEFHNIVVIDVHAFRWLFLVLSGRIVISLIVVKFIGLWAWPLTRVGNVVRALGRAEDASASAERGNELRITSKNWNQKYKPPVMKATRAEAAHGWSF